MIVFLVRNINWKEQMSDNELYGFDWLECTVFIGLLGISAFIGIYFGFIKGGQDTLENYLLGGKKMALLPISASLVCSYISGVALLGVPTEVYTFGTQYTMAFFGFLVTGLVLAFVTIPVFYKLQMLSMYQYLEMRFDSSVRKVISFLYTTYLLLFTPIVIYAPGLALNQVTGVSVMKITLIVSVICIFYTTIGGLKAVVWTDTLQGTIMAGALLILTVVGTQHVGGLSKIIEVCTDGDRFEFFNMDPDPRRRLTFWSAFLGLSALFVSVPVANPSYMQRFIALPTMRKAQWAAIIYWLGCEFFVISSSYMGLVMYTRYKDCDPLTSGQISRPDQVLPFFVVEASRKFPGLAGAFLSGIVSASLSTMSTSMNTVAGTLYSDFIEPSIGQVSDKKANRITKILAVVFGVVCLLLVLVVEKLGSILEMTFQFQGMVTGALLGVFFLGIFFPQANSKGASAGGLGGLVFLTWIVLGSNSAHKSGQIIYETKPASIDGCNFTVPLSNSSTLFMTPSFGKAFPLYEVSVYYICFLGCVSAIVIGLIVSYLTGPNNPEDVNRDLLSPLIYKYLPTYSTVPTKEMELTKI